VTNDLTIEMSRIAQALERIADQGASRMMNRAAEEAATARASAASAAAENEHPRQETPPAPRRIAYSMFGR
jgi:septal ring factor EnvC (AmiA/AmiB activator)